MKDLSNTNPQQPRKSCMQKTCHRGGKEKEGQRIALQICTQWLRIEKKNNSNYKRSILEEEDQKPNKK